MFNLRGRGLFNYQSFTPQEVKKGLLQDLLNYLLDFNVKVDSGYYDIHICSDGYSTIVEWLYIDRMYRGGAGFSFVGPEDAVCTQVNYPDNSYEWCLLDEKDELFQHWLEDNPTWKQDEHGEWYDDSVKPEEEISTGSTGSAEKPKSKEKGYYDHDRHCFMLHRDDTDGGDDFDEEDK